MNAKLFIKRNASTILTCVGGAGVITTSVMAVKATPKALYLLEVAESSKGEELTKFERVRVAGPVYIPTILVGASTLACIFGANGLNKRKQASLMSAYALLDSSFKEYKSKTQEIYGEDADDRIVTEIAKDKYEDIPEEDGKQLFYDEFSKRFFRATNETVLAAQYALNKILVDDSYASVNELYDLFGIPRLEYGDALGWSAAQLFDMYWSSWVNFSHEVSETDDGKIFWIIRMTEPTTEFEDY